MADGAAGVSHVIHHDGHPVLDVPDQNHAVYFVGLLPLFVDEGKVHVQAVGDGCHAAATNKQTPDRRAERFLIASAAIELPVERRLQFI